MQVAAGDHVWTGRRGFRHNRIAGGSQRNARIYSGEIQAKYITHGSQNVFPEAREYDSDVAGVESAVPLLVPNVAE